MAPTTRYRRTRRLVFRLTTPRPGDPKMVDMDIPTPLYDAMRVEAKRRGMTLKSMTIMLYEQCLRESLTWREFLHRLSPVTSPKPDPSARPRPTRSAR